MPATETSNGRSSSPELYRSLNTEDREVRILHLEPGSFTDDIEIRLEVVSIENQPYYEALSYVWGTKKSPRKVLVDDTHKVEIIENLDCALRHLRYRSEHRVLWIDALCINQENDLECNSQVELMGLIYERCAEVLIWLRPDPENRFEHVIRHITDGTAPTSIEDARSVFLAMAQLGDSEWFTRVWVVQELLLPSGDPKIHIGTKVVMWSSARAFLGQILDQMRDLSFGPVEEQRSIIEGCGTGLSNWITFQGLRAASLFSKTPSLCARLKETSDLSATIAHDKIYALLGIAKFRENSIVPRYDLPIQTVLAQATASMLQDEEVRLYHDFPLHSARAADIRISCTVPGRPSWVPDLTHCTSLIRVKSETESSSQYWEPQYWKPHHILGYVPEPEYSSYPSEKSQQTSPRMIKVSSDHKTLSAVGRSLGRISWVSTPQSFRNEGQTSYIRDLFDTSQSHGFSSRTFCSTIFGQSDHSDSDTQCLKEYLGDTDAVYDETALDNRSSIKMVTQRVAYQTIFTTDEGHRGRSYHPAPDGVQSGDILVVLFSVEVPFMLRPLKAGKYNMINVAYVCDHPWASDRPASSLPNNDWSNLDSLGLQVFEIV